jgi:biotin carboxyl carrier protein
MKMQNEIHSPYSGVVKEIKVQRGQAVKAHAVLMLVEKDGR